MSKFNKLREKPLVLLSPLDWGLGHATRCIPLIRELKTLQCEVIIACSPAQKKLLEIEFQSLTFFLAPADPPVYGKNRAATLFRLLLQSKKILTLVKAENRWLQQFLRLHPVDAIISDNRFGLYAPGIPCIFITHQLGVKTGLGAALNRVAQRLNYHFIQKFTECWVPDLEGENSLAGQLSNPSVQPKIPVKRIGPLSRFEQCNNAIERDLLIILSGPEPQRSLLEEKISSELNSYTGKVILVRGLPGNEQLPQTLSNVQVYNHVSATELNKMICTSAMVLSRTGYTTVMDLVKLGKKCILIPTPGQAEQEYLAEHLRNNHLAYTVTQDKFSLQAALQQAGKFPFKKLESSMEDYKLQLAKFVASLRKA